MSLRKLLLFSVATLTLLALGNASGSTVVEGLQDSDCVTTFYNSSIGFDCQYTDHNLSYKDAVIPKENHTDLKKWLVKSKNKNGGLQEVQIQYELSNGYKFDSKLTFDLNDGKRLEYESKGGYWNVSTVSHYEHLILNYTRNGDWQEQDVFSASETTRIPFSSGDTEHIVYPNQNVQKQSLTYDNLYEPDHNVSVVLAVPESDSVRNMNFNGTKTDITYSKVEKSVQDAGLSSEILLDTTTGYKLESWNTTIPADSKKELSVKINTESGGKDQIYMWVLGSAGGSTTIYQTSNFNISDISRNVGWRKLVFESDIPSGTTLQIPYNTSYSGFKQPSGSFETKDLVPTQLYNYTPNTNSSGVNMTSFEIYGSSNLQDSATDGYASWDILENRNQSEEYRFSYGLRVFDDNSRTQNFTLKANKLVSDVKFNIYGFGTGVKSPSFESASSIDRNDWAFSSYPSQSTCGTTIEQADVDSTNYTTDGTQNAWLWTRGTSCDPGYATGVQYMDQDILRGLKSIRMDYKGHVGMQNKGDSYVKFKSDGNTQISYVNSGGGPFDFQYTDKIMPMVGTPPYTFRVKAEHTTLYGRITWVSVDNFRPGYTDAQSMSLYYSGSNIFSQTSNFSGRKTSSSVSISSGNNTLEYSGKGGAVIWTKHSQENSPPGITSVLFRYDRKQSLEQLEFSIDDKSESDIASYNGLSTALEFTNSSLKSSVTLPFSSTVEVVDSKGATSAGKPVDLDRQESSLREHSYGHNLSVQRVNKTVQLMNNAGESILYNLTLKNHGSTIQGESWTGTIAASSSVENTGVWEGDWIDSSIQVFEKGQFGPADLGQQSFYNQTMLETSNRQNVNFTAVGLSSKCSVTTVADVPAGNSTVTTSCTNQSFSGDWIRSENNESTRFTSGEVVIGSGVSEQYVAKQNVSVENVRSDINFSVDFSSKLPVERGCSLVNPNRTVPSASVREYSFEKSCVPGEVLEHEPVVKTETNLDYKYTYRASFQVFSNLTEEQPQTYAVKKSRLSNYEERSPEDTEVYVDGRSNGLSLSQKYFNGTEYVTVNVPDDFGNSSLHEGNHSVKLVYYETKSPGGTSGGGGSGGGLVGSGGSQPTQTVENVTGEYNWTVSAAVSSDTKKFTVARASGDRFNKTILLRNTGSEEVPLNITCISNDDYCQYVDLEVDRVVLNTGSFSQKQLRVSGRIPENASTGSSYTFRILVEDPSSTGLGSDGAATVDFLVSVSDFWGGILSYMKKLLEWRELQPPGGVGEPISYPFAAVPLLVSLLVGGLGSGLRRVLEFESSTKIQLIGFSVMVLTFFISTAVL